jgi:hypothetical protein
MKKVDLDQERNHKLRASDENESRAGHFQETEETMGESRHLKATHQAQVHLTPGMHGHQRRPPTDVGN